MFTVTQIYFIFIRKQQTHLEIAVQILRGRKTHTMQVSICVHLCVGQYTHSPKYVNIINNRDTDLCSQKRAAKYTYKKFK